MLVLQLKDPQHPMERYVERVGGDGAEFLEVVAEINAYLPDDWRMTREDRNFRIQVISDRPFALVGHSLRTGAGAMLHVVDTILNVGQADRRALSVGNQTAQGLSLEGLDESYERIVPNLYLFRPGPDDSASPLFARQYEKVWRGPDRRRSSVQFHRIHPLTPAGLDFEHHRWVRWDVSGEVREVTGPDPTYRGKSYWLFEGEVAGRQLTERYQSTLVRALRENHITAPAGTAGPSLYEVEWKFLVPGGIRGRDKLWSRILDDARRLGFRPVAQPKTGFHQDDLYLDDDAWTLNRAGTSMRVRMKQDHLRLTVKKRVPAGQGYSPSGLYERIEEEAVISPAQMAALVAGTAIPVFPCRILPYVAPGLGQLAPRIRVRTHRRLALLQDGEGRRAELCLDLAKYLTPAGTSLADASFLEIELESKGVPPDDLATLAAILEAEHGLIPAFQSKYERGVSLVKTAPRQGPPTKVIVDTDCGVDDALALAFALKSPAELNVLAITCVSGNVHVDKVVPNVFNVLDALAIPAARRPIVSRGATESLDPDRRQDAASVHGIDGLGDAVPPPSKVTVDPRPAWQVIVKLAREHPKKITLITIGPLTNLALAIREDPEGVANLAAVVAMGGVFFEVGNIAPDAEFNVWADPVAAREVVEFCRDSCLPGADKQCRVQLTFVGLDVTHKVLLRRATVERLLGAHPRNTFLRFVAEISKKYMHFYEGNEGLPGCYLHDPLAVGYVIRPAFLEVDQHIIRVETRGQFTNGVVFPDDRPTRNRDWRDPTEAVIGVACRVEREAFEEFFLQRLLS